MNTLKTMHYSKHLRARGSDAKVEAARGYYRCDGMMHAMIVAQDRAMFSQRAHVASISVHGLQCGKLVYEGHISPGGGSSHMLRHSTIGLSTRLG